MGCVLAAGRADNNRPGWIEELLNYQIINNKWCGMVGESISKLPVEKEFNNLTLNACKENCCGAMNGMFISWRDHVPTRLKNIYWHWRNGCHFCLSFPL